MDKPSTHNSNVSKYYIYIVTLSNFTMIGEQNEGFLR